MQRHSPGQEVAYPLSYGQGDGAIDALFEGSQRGFLSVHRRRQTDRHDIHGRSIPPNHNLGRVRAGGVLDLVEELLVGDVLDLVEELLAGGVVDLVEELLAGDVLDLVEEPLAGDVVEHSADDFASGVRHGLLSSSPLR